MATYLVQSLPALVTGVVGVFWVLPPQKMAMVFCGYCAREADSKLALECFQGWRKLSRGDQEGGAASSPQDLR